MPEAVAPAPCNCWHCPRPCKPRNKRTKQRSPASGKNSTRGRQQPKRAIAQRTGQAKRACATRCCSRTRAKAWRNLPKQAKTGQTECPKRETHQTLIDREFRARADYLTGHKLPEPSAQRRSRKSSHTQCSVHIRLAAGGKVRNM